MRVRKRPVIVAAVLVLVAAVAVVTAVNSMGGKLPHLGPECIVQAGGQVAMDAVQMANAATIAAVGMRREMPERAVVVALATALQESKLENRGDGDRDSVGLFQQRPSQGWGSAEKIQDPRYAADRFYSALKKVKGWEEMRVTDAAQRVQRSAYPNAYEKWADESAVLAKALTGRATGAVACTVAGQPALRGAAAAAALTEGLRRDWGDSVPARAGQAGDLTLAVTDPSTGWRYAHWLVAHARETGLERVRFADLEWRAPSGKWQPVTGTGAADGRTVVAEVFR
ncbi:hypothetical protein [Krasilnikovia sp. MM14-A1259]|uniref:hypothetical protein n=1 Tax=Krasilnikovia sp. MM14-A1259 TaxID=3373539 RepID=UPI003818F9DF